MYSTEDRVFVGAGTERALSRGVLDDVEHVRSTEWTSKDVAGFCFSHARGFWGIFDNSAVLGPLPLKVKGWGTRCRAEITSARVPKWSQLTASLPGQLTQS